MPSNASRARSRLDARLRRLRSVADQPPPHRGWVRAIRDALGMSSRELAERMGVKQQTVVDIERSERRGTVKLETLERAARALDCELVYFLRPRRSLEELVSSQARKQAERRLSWVSHHSRLEDQAVSGEEAAVQLDELADALKDQRGLWTEGPPG